MNKENLNTDDKVSLWQTPHLSDAEQGEPTVRTEKEIWDQIYEDAYVKGQQAGIKKGQEKVEQQLTLLNNLISMLSRPFNEMNQEIAEEVAALSGKIARSLVKRELKTDPGTIIALVRDTIEILNSKPEDIRVHLNPEDAEILREINQRASEHQRWEIIEDSLITRGDCRVGSNESLIDENLQDRINLIVTQFIGDERSEQS